MEMLLLQEFVILVPQIDATFYLVCCQFQPLMFLQPIESSPSLSYDFIYRLQSKPLSRKANFPLEVNNTLKPSHRWTNGPLPLKTIEANG